MFLADETATGVSELFTVRPDGTDRVKVSGPLGPNGYIPGPGQWTADGARIVYAGYVFDPTTLDLFSVRADGTDHVQLTGPAPGFGVFEPILLSQDGASVLFAGHEASPTAVDLRIARVDGTQNQVINAGREPWVGQFSWGP
jgi:hypothetical protein